ncbi:acyl carrier protein [Micromonospora sp. HUAS LYJ1]|uniref:acyl carrier protein n=1 Tax=Micromonospora sp. HUAS LYJ1 TaxID=3061626 RepID=UPI002672ECBD|nr:acyl carrier protein [Micromonospora sp. HUAS LYJ1]WKU05542.1 acyl carrier protein [Micromonospora sp. HUAS LYJ1]
MSDTLTAQLRAYIERESLFVFGDEITEDSDLFKAGVLDSFGYISLMAHVKDEYGVELTDNMLDDVMVSLSSIVTWVEANRAAPLQGR